MNISENKRVVVMSGIFLIAFIGLIVLGLNFRAASQDNIASIEEGQGTLDSDRAKRFPSNEQSLPEVKAAATRAAAIKEQILASTASFGQTVETATTVDGRPISGKELQDKLNTLHNKLEQLCKEKTIKLTPEASWLGFAAFRSVTPNESDAPDLSFELSGIDHFVNTVAANGAVSITKIYRPTVIEPADKTGKPKPTAKKNTGDWNTLPFEISFQAKRGSVGSILEAISQDKEYCYYITGMRIASDLTTLVPLDPFKKPAAPQPEETATAVSDVIDDGLGGGDALGGTPAAEPATAPEEVRHVAQTVAKQILGNETIRVYIACELVRFNTPVKKQSKK